MSSSRSIMLTHALSRGIESILVLTCAVSQPGARRLLYELAIYRVSDSTDLMLHFLCNGVLGQQMGTYFTVQPQLFQHRRPIGPEAGFSDISDHEDGHND